MNGLELLSLFLIVLSLSACYFVSHRFNGWLAPLIARRLQPLLSRLVPALNFTPWLYEPIERHNVPPEQRGYFELHTPPLLKLGFEPLGDFVLRRDPQPSCARFFLSPCRTMYAELSCYLHLRSLGCVSVGLDGTYLESSNADPGEPPPPGHGLRFFILQTDRSEELVAFHQQSAAATMASLRTELAELEAADLKTVLNYGRSLSLHSLHRQGVLCEVPEFLREQSTTQD